MHNLPDHMPEEVRERIVAKREAAEQQKAKKLKKPKKPKGKG